MSIEADKSVLILLVGPPESKSLFMSCLTKLERSYSAVGSSSTKSGILDYLVENRPRYFIIDEIEKMNKLLVSIVNCWECDIVDKQQEYVLI